MADWTGRWSTVIATPMAKVDIVFDLTETDGVLTGTASSGDNPTAELYEGTASGDSAAWKFKTVKPLPLTFAVTATKSGDELTGKAKPGSFPGAKLTGTRAGD